MNLHANAALSLNARRRLVARVVDEGWSLYSAAPAGGLSDPQARKWGGRWPSGPVVGAAPPAGRDAVGAGRGDRCTAQGSADRR